MPRVCLNEDKFVSNFKLLANVVRNVIQEFISDMDGLAFLKRNGVWVSTLSFLAC